jgi:hypothetical protein
LAVSNSPAQHGSSEVGVSAIKLPNIPYFEFIIYN